MAVYVDDMRAPFGRMKLCHMLADSTEELHAMARQLGLPRRYCQHPGTTREHYDVSLGNRARAVELGAVEITQRQAALICREKARLASLPRYTATLPTTPGLYWYRIGATGEDQYCRVVDRDGILYADTHLGHRVEVRRTTGRLWAGPLLPPIADPTP